MRRTRIDWSIIVYTKLKERLSLSNNIYSRSTQWNAWNHLKSSCLALSLDRVVALFFLYPKCVSFHIFLIKIKMCLCDELQKPGKISTRSLSARWSNDELQRSNKVPYLESRMKRLVVVVVWGGAGVMFQWTNSIMLSECHFFDLFDKVCQYFIKSCCAYVRWQEAILSA